MHYDLIIAGGGMAGLSLAWHLSRSQQRDRRILVLDREPKVHNDRTWCWWSAGPSPFDDIVHRKWDRLAFRTDRLDLDLLLDPYAYRMLRGSDFYAAVRRRLEADPRVSFAFGEVRYVRDGEGRAVVGFQDQEFTADWAFDGRFIASEFSVNTRRWFYLKQHFVGWTIEAQRPIFDPSLPVFFDFRVPDRSAFCFMYILPTDPWTGLVEYTWFSPVLLDRQRYEDGIRTWLARHYGLQAEEYQVRETEQGVIPMTDLPLPRRLGKRVMAIGSRGGRIKASTGFAFWRTQQDSLAIVRALDDWDDPFRIPQPPRRYRTFDTMLLWMMQHRPDQARRAFADLFCRNPIQRIFRFLDEEDGWMENLRLMRTVRALPFAAAWLRTRLPGARDPGPAA